MGDGGGGWAREREHFESHLRTPVLSPPLESVLVLQGAFYLFIYFLEGGNSLMYCSEKNSFYFPISRGYLKGTVRRRVWAGPAGAMGLPLAKTEVEAKRGRTQTHSVY